MRIDFIHAGVRKVLPSKTVRRGNVKKRDQGSESAANKMRPTLLLKMAWVLCTLLTGAAAQQPAVPDLPIYKQSQAPIEARIDDLVRRMALAEKVRQLDLYAGAKELVDAHTDNTHAAPTAEFVPAKAEALFGLLGWGPFMISIPLQCRRTPSSNG
jgi:hypothetical protein